MLPTAYFPVSQPRHAVIFAVFAMDFGSQSMHSGMPRSLPYFPGTQGRQIACPVSFWCWPAGHFEHVFEVASPAPLAQPRGHSSHELDTLTLNLPAAQALHVVFPSPEVLWPAGHRWQLCWRVTFAKVFSGQSLHVVRPRSSSYLPGTQGRQMACPGSLWYCPASHATHVCDSSSAPRAHP